MHKRTCCALCFAQCGVGSTCTWKKQPKNTIPQTVIAWVMFNQRPNKIIAEEPEMLVLPLEENYSNAQYCS